MSLLDTVSLQQKLFTLDEVIARKQKKFNSHNFKADQDGAKNLLPYTLKGRACSHQAYVTWELPNKTICLSKYRDEIL